MSNPIGYLIASDFVNGTLVKELLPALVMIKAGNCRFCQITEPEFRALNEKPRNFNMFFMRPYDGTDTRERETRSILYDIVETEDFGFPTFVFFKPNGMKAVHVGSMTLNDMITFVQTVSSNVESKPSIEPKSNVDTSSDSESDDKLVLIPYNM